MSQPAPSGPIDPHAQAGGDAPPHRYGAALANAIEAKWQARWKELGTFRTPNPGEPGFDASRPKKFVLDMFPYPSGVGLHVGHPLGYIATDIYARYLRMTGHNVLHAMGYDAFGLPAEQYAVQTNTHPRITTERNIATMRTQLARLGLAHDDRRSVSTTDEAFYRWTQWIFLKIYHSWYDAAAGRARPIDELVAQYERGERRVPGDDRPWSQIPEGVRRGVIDGHRLAYLAEVPVNWCPALGTVLANEEVIDGRSERGNHPVYRRPLKQWMMRITAYADRLLDDLNLVDWPEPVKMMQRNWIGRSRGAHVDFASGNRRIRVFTTRPDTLYGATYMVLSPEHPLVDALTTDRYGAGPSVPPVKAVFPGAQDLLARGASPRELVAAYRAFASGRTDEQRGESAEKTGVFIGAFAVNPVNEQRIPIFIADYVLMGYGTGAIMAVPAHDERDSAFAGVFGLPVVRVVRPSSGEPTDACFSGDGIAINSPAIDGLPTEQAKEKIGAILEQRALGKAATLYKLRDWLFSRQRYWGEPFPIVFDEQGVPHPLPESMLPVRLPEMQNFQPEASTDPEAPARPPLARAAEWVSVTLDLGDGRGPRRFTRETNTMPNWAGSCWYYLRYLDPANDRALVAPEAERYWMVSQTADGSPHAGGVDLYVGGVEHAVLHLLYARFWHKVLFDLGHVSTPEPFGRLFNQGYIQAAAYTDARGAYVEASQVIERDGRFVHVDPKSGVETEVSRQFGKMGKSLKNAVTPDDVCAEYGCDTLRVYEMSMGPLEASKPWNTRDISGAYRFLQRVWRNLVDEATGALRVVDGPCPEPLRRALHRTIDGVRRDMAGLGFNTAVAKLIEFNNELTRHAAEGAGVPREAAETLALLLAPLAPHLAEELWERLGHGRGLAFHPFPQADPAMLVDDTIEMPVQVLGKLRGVIQVPAKADAKAVEAAALADPKIRSSIEGKTIRKVIVVPGKMINFVVG
ncbi:MAG: leucine--tRNA ligase [Phycisphaeraceae bacterium]|nr:leucine--tRNA ligase [Phycisphaeraceae bacterium]